MLRELRKFGEEIGSKISEEAGRAAKVIIGAFRPQAPVIVPPVPPQFLLEESQLEYFNLLRQARAEYCETMEIIGRSVAATHAMAFELMNRPGSDAQIELWGRDGEHLHEVAARTPAPIRPDPHIIEGQVRILEAKKILENGKVLHHGEGKEIADRIDNPSVDGVELTTRRIIVRFRGKEYLVIGSWKTGRLELRATDSVSAMTKEELEAIISTA